MLQNLGHILPQPAQFAAAFGAGTGRSMRDILARQMPRQGPAERLLDCLGTGEQAA